MAYLTLGTKKFKKANLALFSAGLVTFANLYLTQPLMPQFSKQFSISPATASLSLSAATLMLSFSLLFFGSLSEARGRKRLMTISIFIASILTICIAFTTSFEMLLAVRIVQGFVFAGVPAIAMAYLGEEVEPKSISIAMGLYISGTSIGGLTGRIVMGTFADLIGWQNAAVVMGLFSLLLSLYFVYALPASENFNARPLNLKALTKSLFKHTKNFSLACLFFIGFTLMGSFVTLYNYIGFKLSEAPYNLSATIIGWIFIVYLVGTFSSAWFGRLAVTHGRQNVLYLGIGLMLLGVIVTLPKSLTIIIIGIVIFTFGFFGAHSIASGAVTHRAKVDKAQASSLYLFAYYFGSSVGGTVGGFFWMHFGWKGIVAFISVILLSSICAAVGIQLYDKKSDAKQLIHAK